MAFDAGGMEFLFFVRDNVHVAQEQVAHFARLSANSSDPEINANFAGYVLRVLRDIWYDIEP